MDDSDNNDFITSDFDDDEEDHEIDEMQEETHEDMQEETHEDTYEDMYEDMHEDMYEDMHEGMHEELQESQEETGHVVVGDEEQREKLLQLPLGRIKTIIKMDPEVNMINQEAVFLITKSTELFIDSLAKEAYKYTAQAKKRTIQKHDVENAIDNVDALVFLEGTLD